MTSTRFRMIGVVLFVVALSALEAYRWDGGPEDKAKVKACIGGSASFHWSIVTGLGETMQYIDWWFQAPGEDKTEIAMKTNQHFFAKDNTKFGFLPNAGLSLRYARPQDSGNYSVQVNLKVNSSLAPVWRTVTLSVIDRPPATQDGTLGVTLSDAVRDDVTEDWTLLLHCGQFVDLGHPPVDVVWKTPSGEVRNSSYQDSGTFVLSVFSPVQGGNYSCHLPASAPAARCLNATSPLTDAAAQLYWDDKDVRFLFLEARQKEIEQVNKDQASLLQQQANLLQHQAVQISQQNGTMADIVHVNKDQANLLQQQANLLQHQAVQISQQNETIADMVQVNKDQANLLQHQAMQLQERDLYLNQTISELTKQCITRALKNPADEHQGTHEPLASNTSSCVDWLSLDPLSGLRTVCVSGELVTVYCDQTTDKGGWIVFQRRIDASVDFYRGWTEYRNGFGDLEGNFWLGLDKLHKLTTSQRYELRVDLHKWDGTKGHATYSGFYVDDASKNFALRYDKFTGGNAGDSLYWHNDQPFSTKDRDHDTSHGNCAEHRHGAWWYKQCRHSNLNAYYKPNGRARDGNGLSWMSYADHTYSMKFTEMKIRPM